MSNKKRSGPNTTGLASKLLSDPKASKIQKTLSGSVLAQANTDKITGAEIEDLASKVLKSPKYNDDTKSLAGSLVSQSDIKR
ncbi:MAG TPA: hypothetical protein DCX03_05825 [Bacteroidales bacterium]|nr:hypothetical protein [Bacteroidales bacterium]